MNKVMLIGRLVRSPEVKKTSGGISSLAFTLAVSRNYKNANGTYDADFINCTAWRQTADFIGKYFSKGDMIAVSGAICTRTYDGNDGQKRYVTEVVVDEAYFTGSKIQKQDSFAQAGFTENSDGNLPF